MICKVADNVTIRRKKQVFNSGTYIPEGSIPQKEMDQLLKNGLIVSLNSEKKKHIEDQK